MTPLKFIRLSKRISNRGIKGLLPSKRRLLLKAWRFLSKYPKTHRMVSLKVVYKHQQEMIARMHADGMLELGSVRFAPALGMAVLDGGIVDGNGYNWEDPSALPDGMAIPFGPTASSQDYPESQLKTFAIQYDESDKLLSGVTTVGEALQHLRETTATWLRECQSRIKQEHGWHGNAIKFRLEQIAMAQLAKAATNLYAYYFGGKYSMRRAGSVRTRNPDFLGKCFWFNEGYYWNGHPCAKLKPGRPALSDAQYKFRVRMRRLMRKDRKGPPRKAFKKQKVTVPKLFSGDSRPKIGRKQGIKWDVEKIFVHPLEEKYKKTKAVVGNFMKNPERTMERLHELYNGDTLMELLDEVGENMHKFKAQQTKAMKRAIIKGIVTSAAKEANKFDLYLDKWTGQNYYVPIKNDIDFSQSEVETPAFGPKEFSAYTLKKFKESEDCTILERDLDRY